MHTTRRSHLHKKDRKHATMTYILRLLLGSSPPSRQHCAHSLLWLAFLISAIGSEANAFVLGPTAPGNWGSGGGPITLTYSFMADGIDGTAEAGGITNTSLATLWGGTLPTWQTEIVRALDSWANASGLTFVQVADNGEAYDAAQTSGDLRFGAHNIDGANGTLAHGFYPPNNGNSIAGDVHFDTSEAWKIGFGGGGVDIFQVAAHEIGHAIGLNHTLVPNSLMNANYTEAFSGPQADEIAGAQSLYGSFVGPAPEPMTVTLSLIGLATVAMARRKARKNNKEETTA